MSGIWIARLLAVDFMYRYSTYVMLGAGILGAFVVFAIIKKKWLRDKNNQTGPAFTLEQLEEMRNTQQISQEEYKILRQQIIR
ncbi:MAG: hypothetical protein JW860_12920 [Sedimentisphaerales bacterium]|nr:hypothetical protein [Sedimentisphaerales bacterium]